MLLGPILCLLCSLIDPGLSLIIVVDMDLLTFLLFATEPYFEYYLSSAYFLVFSCLMV